MWITDRSNNNLQKGGCVAATPSFSDNLFVWSSRDPRIQEEKKEERSREKETREKGRGKRKEKRSRRKKKNPDEERTGKV